MVYLSPRPVESESGEYYRHAEYLPFSSLEKGESVTERVYKLGRRLNLRWKRKLIDRHWRGSTAKGPGRLLDVGCGTGEFLFAMKRVGWQVEGIEREKEAAEWGAKAWGVPVHAGDLGSFQTGGQFDVITMWHVLEHLYDPGEAFGRLKDLLSPDGFLLVAVPNIGGVDAMIYREHWIALDLPRHVNHFSTGALARLFSLCGFEPFLRRQLPFDAFFNVLLSEQLGAKRSHSSVLLWPFRFIRAGFVAAVSLIGGSRLFSGRFGPTLVFLARKISG
jgi:2-polyprenyl-3-methyl-5-hydroxy-6-metoxy-1,4-benzoquinol methylase